jgi:hypothetical protein
MLICDNHILNKVDLEFLCIHGYCRQLSLACHLLVGEEVDGHGGLGRDDALAMFVGGRRNGD